ncbi:MAG: hypothetical protein QNJ32_29485 [Xenococcaceae cyanobacterium MO_167.B27]|nr:hypothetical protein [Xenococcaceae cyanobacterium MO_167.B27]
MSSFEVGSKHISAIMTWAIDQGFLEVYSPQDWFTQFYLENLNSVNYRYKENNQLPEQERYRPVMPVLDSRYPREIAIAIYKLARCWCYNSCDHDPWEEDPVWQEIKKIQEKAISISGLTEETISEIKEYDVAPWEYSEKDWKKYISWVKERNSKNIR